MVLELLELTMEAELAALAGNSKMMQELATKQRAENAHRKEEAWPTGDPSGAVAGESSAGNEAVNVGMVFEGLAPGVQDGKDADLRTQVLRVPRNRAQCLRRSSKQNVVDHLLILQSDARKLVRDREDDMEVLDGQDLLLSLGGPIGSRCLLALGAVSIPARVVRDALVPALVALLDVPAPYSRSAGRDIVEHTSFGR